jgi:hypothetical protein
MIFLNPSKVFRLLAVAFSKSMHNIYGISYRILVLESVTITHSADFRKVLNKDVGVGLYMSDF